MTDTVLARSRLRAFGAHVSAALVYAPCAAVILLVLVAVGRPVATDDAWWHLALGRVFAHEGPWLTGDPLLFASPRPASSATWLADVLLAQILELTGFHGLRVAHVACAAAILALAAALLRREAGSRRFAAPALIAFATLAAYRLFQLRPELATILATLLLYPIVLRPREGPTLARIALCAVGMALWANLHAGFLLGPILIATALLGVLGARLVDPPSPADRLRLRRLSLCLAAGLATLANPSGFTPHLAYFTAGERSPELTLIFDEWFGLDLFSWPGLRMPPSRADWILAWALLAGTLAATARAVSNRRRRAAAPAAISSDSPEVDPALVALAWAALAAMIAAVRFLWLGIFALLLIAQASAQVRVRAPAASRWLPGVLSVALLAGFVWIGPWPRISDAVRWNFEYGQPYAARKYFVDSIWLIRDAGLTGRLFADYNLGGFAGFWLAPKVKTFVNGSLNVSPGAPADFLAIAERRGAAEGESFTDLLDRLGIDLFLGTGVPDPTESCTTAHLERTPGWTQIFRNATSSVYLRRHARQAENLRRVADYYARDGIPFDSDLGFEPSRVVRENPDWAVRHRLIPEHFEALERESVGADDSRARVEVLTRTAWIHAWLGLYDAAVEREAQILRLAPQVEGPRRRMVWSLLRAGRYEDARLEAAILDRFEDRDGLLRHTIALVHSLPSLPPDRAEAEIRLLPLLTTEQASALLSMFAPPNARLR